MKSLTRFATICFVLIVLALCLEANAAPMKAAATPQRPPATSGASDWQKKWDDAVAAAKKEGELLIYLNAPSEARIALPEAFKKKFGITLNVVMGFGAQLVSRFDTEYRSGIHQVDAVLPGTTSATVVKTNGFLSPIAPLLILPEVTDPRLWLGQRLPMFDKDGMILAYLSHASVPVIYNTELVKEGQVASYLDLLKPEWKGKMVMFDPTISGSANFWAAGLTQELGVSKANDFLTALLKQQEVMVTREMGQQMEWVSRGKYPLALFPQAPAINQYLKAGAPIAPAAFKDLAGVTPGNGGLTVPTHPPHPNASVVFVNWFLSKEGQTVAVKSMGSSSTRLDVSHEGVDPMFVIKPGQKFFLQSEEFNQNIIKWVEEWKKIFNQTRG